MPQLKSGAPLSDQRIRLLRDSALGMSHLHSLDVVHRDLSLDNVLIASDGTAKIADFGVSKVRE